MKALHAQVRNHKFVIAALRAGALSVVAHLSALRAWHRFLSVGQTVKQRFTEYTGLTFYLPK